jgi:hypothetical protein
MLDRGDELPADAHATKPPRTFMQRLGLTALWYGIPAVCLELFGIPRNLWPYVLMFVLPATAAGVVAGAMMEHAAITRRSRASG